MSKLQTNTSPTIFSGEYWRAAAKNFTDVKILAIAALFIALRIAVKFFDIQFFPGLHLSLDCYVNSLGSMIYGPLVSLVVGLLSDSLGYVLDPGGYAYFFPYTLIEMSSSFIFALFFWKRNVTVGRAITAKFTINLICNIVLSSIASVWYNSIYYGASLTVAAITTYATNIGRVVKNIVLFPFEAILIAIIIGACIPALKRLGIVAKETKQYTFSKKHIIYLCILVLVEIALLVFFFIFLEDILNLLKIELPQW